VSVNRNKLDLEYSKRRLKSINAKIEELKAEAELVKDNIRYFTQCVKREEKRNNNK